MTRRHYLTILAGALLIAFLTPLSQFLTYLCVNASVETATPVAWAVGTVFSLALCAAALRFCGGHRLLNHTSLALLYAMLAVAVPLMNLGLVRPAYLAASAVLWEYLGEGTNTYRTAYRGLSAEFFPLVPTPVGLAEARAERMLEWLGIPARPPASPEPQASREALTFLQNQLTGIDEFVLISRPSQRAALNLSLRRKVENLLSTLSPEEHATWVGAVRTVEENFLSWQEAARRLSAADRDNLWQWLAQARLQEWQAADPLERTALRDRFLYLLSREQRRILISRDGRDGYSNQNFRAFREGLWRDPAAVVERDHLSLGERWQALWQGIPWEIWRTPLLFWGSLFLAIFLGLLFFADRLRKKWVDQENLAFPLVEMIDHCIRHDFRLELASDITQPEPRKRLFYPLFWVGFVVGFLILAVEAMGHYGFLPGRPVLELNLNQVLFSQLGGSFRIVLPTIFVLSPIVVGLAYLLTLELSFSIWISYLLYIGASWLFLLLFPDVKDSVYSGFDGGKLLPYPMEQMLGAGTVFAGVLLLRMRDRGKGKTAARNFDWSFLAGLLLCLYILCCLWWLGVRHWLLLLLFCGFVGVQTLVAARLRAETGLPTSHVSNEFTKLPILFGLTGMTGAQVYAAYINIVFLPITLLFRSLPQLLENFELGRRYQIPVRAMSVAAVLAFLTALTVGGTTFLLFAYYWGSDFYGGYNALPPNPNPTPVGLAAYPLWVSHFLGEPGLDKFDSPVFLRLGFMAAGAAVVGLILLGRKLFYKFPLHPIGYLVVLFSIYYNWVSPYSTNSAHRWETSLLWGSVFTAWLIKRLLVNYGGMNSVRRAKPLFIGLAVGAVVAVFAFNTLDLACSLAAIGQTDPGPFLRRFTEVAPFSPAVY